MADYYRLPNDFPGMDTRPQNVAPIDRVKHIERKTEEHFGNPKHLRLFLALHEFEAWLFVSPEDIAQVTNAAETQENLAEIRDEFESPEDINERPDQSPSCRILSVLPQYRKALHGPTIAKRIGLGSIRRECPHFNEWLENLEKFARE